MVIAGLALCFLVSPAAAEGCEEDVLKVKQALEKMDLSEDERAQITDMNEQADELCKAGNSEEAGDVLAEEKAMLKLD